VNALKHPLQAILIAPDDEMRTNILSGKKEITIREGHRDYRNGLAMICCHLEPWAVQVDIETVVHCRLRDLGPNEYRADGFVSREDMLDGMRQYYPHLDWDSPVTVIQWTSARGKLVAEYNARL
jgi:hypothetical protein